MLSRVLGRAQLSEQKRVDDNEVVFQSRIKVFLNDTLLVVNSFRDDGNFIEIDSENSTDAMIAQLEGLVSWGDKDSQ